MAGQRCWRVLQKLGRSQGASQYSPSHALPAPLATSLVIIDAVFVCTSVYRLICAELLTVFLFLFLTVTE